MKISSVHNTNQRQQTNINNKKNINFKGGADALVNFWQVVDSSRALQFTVEDMLGTNLPRTYKGAMAGYKYTGKINVLALAQEALREFLTGPIMCIVPAIILNNAKKHLGSSANTKIENISNLSYLAEKATKGNNEITKNKFYTTVVDDMLRQSVGDKKYTSKDVKSLVQGLEEIDILNQGITKDLARDKKREIKHNVNQAIDNLHKTYEKIAKKGLDNYDGKNLLNVSYSINNVRSKGTDFKNYISYVTSYAEDIAKSSKKNGLIDGTIIKKFKNTLLGNRLLVFASMIGITGIFMSYIPKLYTWASGGINPNASAIYDKAKGTNQTSKEVK